MYEQPSGLRKELFVTADVLHQISATALFAERSKDSTILLVRETVELHGRVPFQKIWRPCLPLIAVWQQRFVQRALAQINFHPQASAKKSDHVRPA